VIAGIGFLGAGTIIRAGSSIKGLTTAASIWTVAAIGLAVGCGYYLGAFFTTVIMLIALLFFRKIESAVVQRKD
jgi:putative Mg2+ transporter-C (MgtC) family protein